jgi:tetratricopeptide (TPR) repeat protein
MSGRNNTRRLGIAAGAGVLTLAALVWANPFRPAPSLEGLDALLASKRFDEAQQRLEDYLRRRPESDQAHMLMAQVALARDDQRPQLALEHLECVRAPSDPLRALVRFNAGRAYSALRDYVRAEAAWLEALALDPQVPEAGWALLGLYYVEGRRREAERLGLALHASEPDPRDRVQLLLELVRQDAKPIVAFTIVDALEPAIREHPNDVHATIALGRAAIKDDHFDKGLAILRRLTERFPNNPDAWDALLGGLDASTRPEEFAAALERLPRVIADNPRFLRYAGIAAQYRGDWPKAEAAFVRARQFDPTDTQVVYRLTRVLHMAGRISEARQLEEQFRAAQSALLELLPLYNEANADTTFSTVPNPHLYHRIADLRERMGLRPEALAWHRLVLVARPDDADSLAAAQRLADARLPRLGDLLSRAR